MRLLSVILLVLASAPTWAQTSVEQATQLLNQLTLEQKVGQLFLVYHSPGDFMAQHGFGGSLVMESMVRDEPGLKESLQEANRLSTIPLLVAMDQEGGEINRLRPLPGFEEIASAEEMGLRSEEHTSELQSR